MTQHQQHTFQPLIRPRPSTTTTTTTTTSTNYHTNNHHHQFPTKEPPTHSTSKQHAPFETINCFVRDTQDAQLLIEACIAGHLPLVHDLPPGITALPITSGTTIVFAEKSDQSLRMRWRDGAQWSCSRICGPFLLYRQVTAIKGGSPTLPPIKRKESCNLFITCSVRKNSKLVLNGFAKRTITMTGSDKKRYRVINYFYPSEVEYLYSSKKTTFTQTLATPSTMSQLEAFKKHAPIKQEEPDNRLLTRFISETCQFRVMQQNTEYFRRNPNWTQTRVILAPLEYKERK